MSVMCDLIKLTDINQKSYKDVEGYEKPSEEALYHMNNCTQLYEARKIHIL
jgi:hypothetical protein